jgi:hypothetical protein
MRSAVFYTHTSEESMRRCLFDFSLCARVACASARAFARALQLVLSPARFGGAEARARGQPPSFLSLSQLGNSSKKIPYLISSPAPRSRRRHPPLFPSLIRSKKAPHQKEKKKKTPLTSA